MDVEIYWNVEKQVMCVPGDYDWKLKETGSGVMLQFETRGRPVDVIFMTHNALDKLERAISRFKHKQRLQSR